MTWLGTGNDNTLGKIGSLMFEYADSSATESKIFSIVVGMLMMFVALLLCIPLFRTIPIFGVFFRAERIYCAFLTTLVWTLLLVCVSIYRFYYFSYGVWFLTSAVAMVFAVLKLLYDRGKIQAETEKRMLQQIGNVAEQIADGKSIDEIDFKRT